MERDNTKIFQTVIIVGGLYFLVIKPILQKLGIQQSPEEKELEKIDTVKPSNNVWSGEAYLSSFPKGTKYLALKDALAKQYAKQIYDAFGFFGDDEAVIFGIFRALKTQSQVAWLVNVFKKQYKTDLLTFLQKGNKSAQIYRPTSSGLNATEMQQILNIIKSKPKYK